MENADGEYDVTIVGAGISGITFAYRLQTENPNLTYLILEGRGAIDGTWDSSKYPGIRSDSDLYTFGFPWRPWTEQKGIAEGHMIATYINESAAMYGIDQTMKINHQVSAADWSSEQQAWSISANDSGISKTFRSHFLLLCTGYYDYHQALPAMIPGIETLRER